MTLTRPLSPADEASPSREIYLQLRGLIVSGMLAANERLPTVRQTAADLGVAPGTVAKAYKLLEQEGLVVSRTAAGTRVAESAAVLPHAVLKRIRDLTDEALRTGTAIDDVVSVLRAQWNAQTEQAAS
ncbi:GntR family transcriptional regulator [Microbacterium sp. cf332]|uniref:GntR family transcriptional regulator n=1 Tax=Microbacterium sp. cf332 TaxID=1761804 RepID=UPI000883C2BB|nr:GntR family transcriptional regulator [Microbacterium sp. cf332]SDQ89097.1 DNA-binding transcriptional regulator YhcF, GntR family [Microbacterium sp. cf332]